MSSNQLHHALLRPAILHILRASGFHSARPSVVDALTDIAARYILLLATNTAQNAYSNHNTPEPDITDVRMAMQDAGLLIPSMTATEELWQERFRPSLESFPERAREKERQRRDAEDTRDVRGFIDWVEGKQHQEIRRIAGYIAETRVPADIQDMEGPKDYLTVLKQKHSKLGQELKFQGTLLGVPAEDREVKIEGGPVESIQEWVHRTRGQAQQERSPPLTSSDDELSEGTVVSGSRESSVEVPLRQLDNMDTSV